MNGTEKLAPRESWFSRFFRSIGEFFRRIFGPATPNPSILDFRPIRGHPGSRLVISGENFSGNRQENKVVVGGEKALVVTADPNRLEVITAKSTLTGPVQVEVGGRTGDGPVDFEALDPPPPNVDGPPVFYEGAGQGVQQVAPSKGTLRVLVVLCQAGDLAPPNPANTRTDIVDTFTTVHDFYDQASYGDLDVDVDVTANWRTLDGTISDMMAGDNLDSTRLNQIIAEAAQQAVDEGFTLGNYTLIAAMVYTNAFIRAWGGGSYKNFSYTNASAGININITVANAISAIWINESADWGRCAHEIGHCIVDTPGNLSAWENALVLGEDVYRSDLVDSDAATAADFDMMGTHDDHPLFSGYYMEQMEYYSPGNILERTWDRNPHDETIEIVAHGDTENTLGNRYHLVRIKVTDGLYYYIEVRQRPDASAASPALYDENIPLNGAANQGGVIVTKVLTDTVNMNQQMRFITLLHEQHVLTQGDKATDPARYLEIEVTNDNLVSRPLTCQVRVKWAQVVGDTPGGDFDLRIRPWNESYETPDIWVDRPPYGTYDYTDPTTGDPTGNGDKPQVKKKNKLYARVHCDGQVDATNVRMTFYVVTPPGVGDNGNWGPLETKVISSVTKDSSAQANVIWVPEVGQHTCLKIYAEPQAGEVNAGGNNWAQENVFDFEAASSSIPDPVVVPVAVRNPLDARTPALISVRNVPEGFTVHFPHQWVWLAPKQERRFELLILPTLDYNHYHQKEIPRADIVVDGWIPRSYEEPWDTGEFPGSWFLPMGGIMIRITPKRRVTLRLEEDQEVTSPNEIGVRGFIDPPLSGEMVSVELEDPDGIVRTQEVYSGGSGQFTARFNLLAYSYDETGEEGRLEKLLRGVYVAQAFVINAQSAASTESNRVFITRT